MPIPPRPSLQSLPDSTSSNLFTHTASSNRLYPLFAGLTFHVLPAKIPDIARVYDSIDELGGKCVALKHARIIITALRGRPRLVRALGAAVLDKRANSILGIEFVDDTYEECLRTSVDNPDGSKVPHLPSRRKYRVISPIPPSPESQEPSLADGRKRKREASEEGDIGMLPEDVKLADIPKWCVLRACPLVCVNQDIIDAIKPIYLSREFEERGQLNSNVLSYRRSMSMLKSVPRRIRSGKEAMKLSDVGEKVAARIDEYLQTGTVAESEEILRSPRYQAMKEFASVYTVGSVTAKELYDKWNCRVLEDVRKHYEYIAEESPEVRLKEKVRRRKQGGMLHVDIVEEWMKLKEDLDTPIPREEVEEIAACVMEHLGAFIEGCEYTICGGYRRGKPQSNDVDVVFCPPEDGQDLGLLRELYLRLGALDLVTHVLHTTQREEGTPIHATPNNFDNLDKAFTIFKLPGKGRLHRRVDLISAPKERYAAAVLSWSGSMMFERDLRRYIEHRGLKFRAGLIEPSTTTEINLPTERAIFEYIGLKYVPPELRNADG